MKLKMLVLMCAFIFSSHVFSCPQFKMENVTCVTDGVDTFHLSHFSVQGSTVTFAYDGIETVWDLPMSGVNGQATYELYCDGKRLVDSEVINGETYTMEWNLVDNKLIMSGMELFGYYLESGKVNSGYTETICSENK